jgi:hypothetical protein
MAQARQLRTANDEPLMNSDAHPLVGWARFLEWQRLLHEGLTAKDRQRLKEAINKATLIYNGVLNCGTRSPRSRIESWERFEAQPNG